MRSLLIAAAGCVLALLLALGLGFLVTRMHRKGALAPAAEAAAGLQIETDDSRAAHTQLLRCFVGGQFAGMATIAQCAAKNGVASQTVDDGLDPATGAAPNGTLAPPPPTPAPAPVPEPAPQETAEAQPAPAAECLRYGGEGWRSAAAGVSVAQCARTLFEGRCVKPGEALYGRWGGETLRLVTGRVEMSSDNRSFHPLVAQNPDCSLPSG